MAINWLPIRVVLVYCLEIALISSSGMTKFKLPLNEFSGPSDLEKAIEGNSGALLCFISSQEEAGNFLKIFKNAAEQIEREKGTMHIVDCSEEGKTLCSELRVSPDPYTLQYYRHGKFNKAYDGNPSLNSIIRFMKTSKEELPWEDVPSEVVHLDEESFKPFLRQKRHALVMFYAPWCGHCKNAKPQFQAAAELLKDEPKFAFAAVDCTQHHKLCNDVRGYPTINYYNYFNMPLSREYEGDRRKSDFIEFMASIDEEFRSKKTARNEL